MMNGIRMVKAGELFATFKFDGKDCADMGIYNVTSGSVYTMNIEPTFSDQRQEVPAYDGKYYYGTQITGQQFQFHCFCHDLTITEYDNLRTWLAPRKIGRLILSDQPYKYYLVKVSSISTLGDIPMTSIQTAQNTTYGARLKGEVVYTGSFNVTFETVGSAYGYGLAYYRDDLCYDICCNYGVDYYYNSGLLYKDMCPTLEWEVNANAWKQDIPIYNPGTAPSAPVYHIQHSGTYPDHSFIQITNETTGSSTVIDLSGCMGNVTLDMIGQIVIDQSGVDGYTKHYGRFTGSAMSLGPTRDLIIIPESLVKEEEYTPIVYPGCIIDNSYPDDGDYPRVTIDPSIKVWDLGKKLWNNYYFCCNHNGGSRIYKVWLGNDPYCSNRFTLYDYLRDMPVEGCWYEYRGTVETISNLPARGNEGDVYFCCENCTWYFWRALTETNSQGKWEATSMFYSIDDFKDEFGNLVRVYRRHAAALIQLDKVIITTGYNIKYRTDEGIVMNGASMNNFTMTAELLPRYL